MRIHVQVEIEFVDIKHQKWPPIKTKEKTKTNQDPISIWIINDAIIRRFRAEGVILKTASWLPVNCYFSIIHPFFIHLSRILCVMKAVVTTVGITWVCKRRPAISGITWEPSCASYKVRQKFPEKDCFSKLLRILDCLVCTPEQLLNQQHRCLWAQRSLK